MGRDKVSFDEKKVEVRGCVFIKPTDINRLGGITKLRSIAKNAVKQAINNEIEKFNLDNEK
jgi:hypothetical protein